ncbi:copper transporter [Nocardioides KLBMP 9356]|uniref:Copper transporter n=1 Tax=Nocardioides potassii TaxID=2911371 RepID=A0ABS9HBD9_9ACTN|nr:copper transporter [Nocardioides potassii]MCF6377799.1 copper transporter [Nocardioides potassii]
MITLRHHLLTIVAVFLALAAGIVLGGGPLSGVGPAVTTAATERSDAPPQTTAQADYDEAWVSALTAPVLGGRLADRSVVLVTVPGADEQVVADLSAQVEAAGGTVAGRYALGADLVDPAQKSLVDTLGSQLLTQQAEGVVPAEASTYDRIGQLIGLAVASKEADGEDTTRRTRAIADAVSGAGLMELPGDAQRRAPLVLLVLGTDAGDEGSDAILSGLVDGLASQAMGVVVAGTLADGDTGQLGRLRATPSATRVTTVDGIDTLAGRATAVMALARALTTPSGSFGASGADGPVPLG